MVKKLKKMFQAGEPTFEYNLKAQSGIRCNTNGKHRVRPCRLNHNQFKTVNININIMERLLSYFFIFMAGNSFAWLMDCLLGMQPINGGLAYLVVTVFLLSAAYYWHRVSEE